MKRFLCIIAALLLLTGPISAVSAAETGLFCAAAGDAAADPDPSSRMDWTDSMIDELLELHMRREGADNLQQLIDLFAQNAGSGEQWYVLILTQLYPGQYDYSAYRKALEEHVSTSRIPNPTTRELLALTLTAVGSGTDFADETLDDAVGEAGLMSYVFGLHLINNGASGEKWMAVSVISEILDRQKADGGWAVMGDVGDVDVTAMTLQALAGVQGGAGGGSDAASAEGERREDIGESGGGSLPVELGERVRVAVARALDFLAECQLPDGGFSSMGTYNCESGAQVWLALSTLGIDAAGTLSADTGRTLPESLMDFCGEGGFAHTVGGEANASANRQILHALAAYKLRFGGAGGDGSGVDSLANAGRNIYLLHDCRLSNDNNEYNENTDASFALNDKTDGEGAFAPADEDTEGPGSVASAESDGRKSHGLRMWISIAVAAGGVLTCAALLVLKKKSWKSYVFVGIVSAALLLAVNLIDVALPSDYYGDGNISAAADEASIETYISIRCDTIAGERDYIPADGTILDRVRIDTAQGASVYTQLVAACRRFGIQLESEGTSGVPYISGIAYIYEADFGELSGWMFRVNGVFSAVGAGEAGLANGDEVEWVYTRDLGHDVGDEYRPAE